MGLIRVFIAVISISLCCCSDAQAQVVSGHLVAENLCISSADQTTALTTYTNWTACQNISVIAGELWEWDCRIRWIGGATIRLSVNGPATSTLDYEVLIFNSESSVFDASQTAYDTATDPTIPGAAGPLGGHIWGTATFSATGNFSIRFATPFALNPATIKRGSWCTFLKRS